MTNTFKAGKARKKRQRKIKPKTSCYWVESHQVAFVPPVVSPTKLTASEHGDTWALEV